MKFHYPKFYIYLSLTAESLTLVFSGILFYHKIVIFYYLPNLALFLLFIFFIYSAFNSSFNLFVDEEYLSYNNFFSKKNIYFNKIQKIYFSHKEMSYWIIITYENKEYFISKYIENFQEFIFVLEEKAKDKFEFTIKEMPFEVQESKRSLYIAGFILIFLILVSVVILVFSFNSDFLFIILL